MENKDYKILLVDDEADILEFLGYNLSKEGYQIYKANNGRAAIKCASEILPHLIILDVMMPEMDGVEACIEIRKISSLKDCIITFLTARSEDYSQIAGLEAGADDYISKPIKPKVFVSKIKALLRRYSDSTISSERSSNGTINVDRERYAVYMNDKEYILPRKEFELLFLLASKPNKVFTRKEIFDRVWGDDSIVGDRTIDVHVRKIRERLGTDNIKTVKGVGYKYED
jgi:two-component system, OmpR family, alkaline phosphatase synthesis response regulator PhoP